MTRLDLAAGVLNLILELSATGGATAMKSGSVYNGFALARAAKSILKTCRENIMFLRLQGTGPRMEHTTLTIWIRLDWKLSVSTKPNRGEK